MGSYVQMIFWLELLLANRAAILNTLRREFYNQELLRVDLQ